MSHALFLVMSRAVFIRSNIYTATSIVHML